MGAGLIIRAHANANEAPNDGAPRVHSALGGACCLNRRTSSHIPYLTPKTTAAHTVSVSDSPRLSLQMAPGCALQGGHIGAGAMKLFAGMQPFDERSDLERTPTGSL